jgi:hypothetical protein
MSFEDLLAWNRLTGEYYGSEDQSIFFYSYCKMQRPRNVLELGTGLGHTALWMAQAMKENDDGHVWTVDNGVRWPETLRFLANSQVSNTEHTEPPPAYRPLYDAARHYINKRPECPSPAGHVTHLDLVADALGLSSFVTFLAGTMSLTDTAEVTVRSCPFLARALADPIDMLYLDFDHYPHAVLAALTKYLPLMSECSSIFIDSASTYLPSHLILTCTVDQLNSGKLPAIMLAGTTRAQQERLKEIVSTRRFIYLALPEAKNRNQNGLAWIRIEPVNVVPYPLTQLRGFFSRPLPREALESLFGAGALPEGHVHTSFLFEQVVRAAYPLTEAELRLLLALIAGRRPPQ